jgi:hypothetical protein
MQIYIYIYIYIRIYIISVVDPVRKPVKNLVPSVFGATKLCLLNEHTSLLCTVDKYTGRKAFSNTANFYFYYFLNFEAHLTIDTYITLSS